MTETATTTNGKPVRNEAFARSLQHLKPAGVPAPRKCPECGCSQNRACWTVVGTGCWWVVNDAGTVVCCCCVEPTLRVNVDEDDL